MCQANKLALYFKCFDFIVRQAPYIPMYWIMNNIYDDAFFICMQPTFLPQTETNKQTGRGCKVIQVRIVIMCFEESLPDKYIHEYNRFVITSYTIAKTH